jgi:integrase
MDRTIFRLACCCGLRVSEIAQLRLGDVQLDSLRPHIRIRAAIAKCGRARRVPLWWDAGTLSDITAVSVSRSVIVLAQKHQRPQVKVSAHFLNS